MKSNFAYESMVVVQRYTILYFIQKLMHSLFKTAFQLLHIFLILYHYIILYLFLVIRMLAL